jgi:hypothetical protein
VKELRTAKDETKVHTQRNGLRKRNNASSESQSPIMVMQNELGNRAVNRLLAQRKAEGATELDDEIARQINQQRGAGQPLDSAVQTKFGPSFGQDFSHVRIHTSSKADTLNRQINAKAFTTGNDIFFREGAYAPHSHSGEELIAHELTHVVQQGSGSVNSGGRMSVNAPDDRFEREAESVSKLVTSADAVQPSVQRQELEEEEVQMQEMAPEEEEMLAS